MKKDIKVVLWDAANALRAQMDAAEYKHIVLGLVFLKYLSDAFISQQKKIRNTLSDLNSQQAALENRDYYTQNNVFWVPKDARWKRLQAQAKQSDIGIRIDNAMTIIERENPPLKGKLNKCFGRAQLEQGVLGELIDLISNNIKLGGGYDEKDLLGEIYEYFLGKFASDEGKRGGQFYTPAHVVKTLVAVLSPTSGLVYDPCCGSGGMFVQSERFVKSHGGRVDDISIYGQESNPTTWRLASMNLAIRGLTGNLGEKSADTFSHDQFPRMKFDYIMANPHFNDSKWRGERYENDSRWEFGRPPPNNANYAWLQHILWKLKPSGSAGVVLANGSMSSNNSGEGQIREAMIKGDVVEVMIALPGQLFLNTQIPACLWFMTHDKTKNGRNRCGETLFIDARKLGTMETRALKILTDNDIAKISDTVQAWKSGDEYRDVTGFCKSASLEEIKKNHFVLTPGRYVGAELDDEDSEEFSVKFDQLTSQLSDYQKISNTLDEAINKNLEFLSNG